MKKETALQLCQLADEAIKSLTDLLIYSNTNVELKDDQGRIRLAVAACLAELELEVRDLAYKKFPELKPANLP